MNITGNFDVEIGSYNKTAIYNFDGAFSTGSSSITNFSRQISTEAATPWKTSLAFNASRS